jgi:hypothetical protein
VGVIVAGALALAGDGLRTRRVGAALAIVGANILVIAAYTLVDGSASARRARAELHRLDVRPHGADAGAGAAVARRSRAAAIARRVGLLGWARRARSARTGSCSGR